MRGSKAYKVLVTRDLRTLSRVPLGRVVCGRVRKRRDIRSRRASRRAHELSITRLGADTEGYSFANRRGRALPHVSLATPINKIRRASRQRSPGHARAAPVDRRLAGARVENERRREYVSERATTAKNFEPLLKIKERIRGVKLGELGNESSLGAREAEKKRFLYTFRTRGLLETTRRTAP